MKLTLILFLMCLLVSTSERPAHAEPSPTPSPSPSPVPSPAAIMVKIEGRLREKGTRNPLPHVNIYSFSGPDFDEDEDPKPVKATTDAQGMFSIEVPEGDMKWVISLAGYNRLKRRDQQLAGKESRLRDFYLEKVSYLTYETTVYGETEKRDDKTKTLDRSQFLTVPGANGDPVKAVQNLPGVNRSSFASGQVIIEGSSPNDTRFNIDNQNVPIIFHFGGLSSVVFPEAVDRVDYLSAGFGPEYGQSIAGMVNLTVKDPQTDRMHGLAFVDLLNTGALVEGPINDHSSFLLAARQSYIGFVLRAVVGKNNKNLNFTAAPDFEDVMSEYRFQVTPKDSFKLLGVGSRDTLGFLFAQPAKQDPSIRGNFSTETDFYRLIPEWTHNYSKDVIGRTSFGFGRDYQLFNIGDIYSNTYNTAFTVRAEVEDQINPYWKSFWGIDSQFYWTTISFQLPASTSKGGVGSPVSGSTTRTASNNYSSDASGLYWRNVLHTEDAPLTFMPGIRLSYFNLTKEAMPEPRLAARYALGNGWTLRSSTGLYDEAPPVQDLDATSGNANLKSQRAVHGTLGFEKDFRGNSATGWTITNDFFYKYLYDLVANTTAFVSPSQPEFYDNSGFGHVYGSELLAKYKTSSWEGWISYTLSRSTRGDAQTPEALSQYDQTHLLTAVGDLEVGNNCKFSARVRYTTGNAYTPIVGATFDVDNDVYLPARGDVYSQRLSPFFEVDIRFDKKWIYDKWILTGYLDVENATNRANAQQIQYDYNYQQSTVVSGLPIFPTLGVKGEF